MSNEILEKETEKIQVPEENSVVEEKIKKVEFKPYSPIEEKGKKDVLTIFLILVLMTVASILILCIIFTYLNMENTKIHDGIKINNIDISQLTKEEAINKINEYINSNIPEEINLNYLDYETTMTTELLQIKFDVEEAVNIAYSVGRQEKLLKNDLDILRAKVLGINIEPSLIIDEVQLKEELSNISSEVPDKIIESSFYIEDNNLVITKGKEGASIKIDEMSTLIEEKVKRFQLKNPIELLTEIKQPKEIDIANIYEQVHKEAKDAYYQQDPYVVYPSENGLDFNISIDEAKEILKEDKEEYQIPLKVLYPNVTTNMIGAEAFPDLLSTFSTKYAVSNTNRTTNLILASNKINGTVVMPGETFSYNAVVGERTIEAGYKEAAIYLNGEVVDGLGGGICQITTTLYNAVVFANLEIVERRNHQFVPSYVGASRDATVVYGVTDFKFKNNREYPIKIVCSVANGVANFQIFGLKTNNEYNIEIQTRILSSTANSITSEAYKITKQNGKIISTEILSKDIYKKH